jgi:trimeric autotransporter adhesin
VTTFTGCTIDTAHAGDVLTATDATDGLTGTSSSFDVAVGSPAQLVFTTQPSGAVAGSAFTGQPVVTIEDAGGNTVTTDDNAITLAILVGSGTLSGCTSTTTGGVATFSGCTIGTSGEHTLRANDVTDAQSGMSDEFDVTS